LWYMSDEKFVEQRDSFFEAWEEMSKPCQIFTS
jgi:hypothetical protein